MATLSNLSSRLLVLCLFTLSFVACDSADPSGGTTGGPGGGDTVPPSVTSATTNGSRVTISFNEALDPVSVRDEAFTISPAGRITSATASGSTVTLTLASALNDSPQRSYTVSYSGVRDVAGNAGSGSVSFDYGTDPPARTALRIDFSRIEVDGDCDGALDGDGEFRFRVRATTGTGDVHTAYSGTRNLGDGDAHTGLTDRTFDLPATDGQTVVVEFRASEIDRDIFGNTFNDDRMNNRTGSTTHRFNNGSWSQTGARTITLGSGNCRVQLDYAALPQ